MAKKNLKIAQILFLRQTSPKLPQILKISFSGPIDQCTMVITTSLGENFRVGRAETSRRTQAQGVRHDEAGAVDAPLFSSPFCSTPSLQENPSCHSLSPQHGETLGQNPRSPESPNLPPPVARKRRRRRTSGQLPCHPSCVP